MAFDLEEFLPYLLNRAAEKSSLDFQRVYKTRYNMLRMEWRVLFHLGVYGEMTAKEICTRADLHKTKVSRAVAALADKRYLNRSVDPHDRRQEHLSLTRQGQEVHADLTREAQGFNQALLTQISPSDHKILVKCLTEMS